MRKYLALVKMVFLDQLEYPAEVGYTLLIALPQLFLMSFLWLTIYASNSRVGSFNLNQIITYYFLVLLIGRLHAHPAWWMQNMIEQGEVSNFLTKPFSFLNYILAHSFVRRVANLLIALPVFLGVWLLLKNYLLIPSYDTLILFTISLIMSLALYYLLGICFGMVTFWTMEIGSLIYFFYTSLDFFGGATLPISFFPFWLQTLLNFLPFKYLYYFPSQIFLNKIYFEEISQGFIVSLVWVFILIMATKFIWRKGIKKYSSFGG